MPDTWQDDFVDSGRRATLRAVVDRVIPRDDFPSASEAGVLDFLDRLVPAEGMSEDYEAGLDGIDQFARDQFGVPFIELDPDEQDRVLKHVDGPVGRFFDRLVEQVIEGYYADPGNGGNRDGAAWQMMGYRVTA